MFGTSVSGIKNSQKHIDVTSNNIANTNSYGFKKSRAEFADVYANSVFTNSKTNAGMGVQNTVVSQQFVQGALSGDTGNPLDMAIQGNGFFVLKGPGSNAQTFTRNGAFQINKEGYVVTAMGDFLQGWNVNPDGTTTSLDLSGTHNIRLPPDTGAPKMSTNVSIGVNLPADKPPHVPAFPPAGNDPWTNDPFPQIPPVAPAVQTQYPQYGTYRGADGKMVANGGNNITPGTPPAPADAKLLQYYLKFDPNDASTYTASTSQTIHDSLGRPHTLTYFMIKTGPEQQGSNNTNWVVLPYVNGHPADVAGNTAKGYDENPVVVSVTGNTRIAGSNLFGFQMTFGPSGEVVKTIPKKIELVNPAPDEILTDKYDSSLRQYLFGNPSAPAGDPNAQGELHKTHAGAADPTFTFDGQRGRDGTLHSAIGQGVEPHQLLNIQFAATQYGSSNFTVSQAPTNDGFATGILIGMNVDENGIIQCEYSNGQVKNIAKLAMADFANVQGLLKIGDTQWKQSNSSGEPMAKEANSGSCGSIKGANLELSNVDLTTELVELITAQRNYQANAQSLQTQNTVMDAILNVR